MENIGDSSGSSGFSTAIVFVIAILGLIWTFKRSKTLPPGPINPLTILTLGKNRFIKLTQFSKDYGPVYSFRGFGTSLFVVLNNMKLINEALVEKADVFSNRISSRLVEILNDGTKGSIVLGNGENWKEMRRFGSQALRNFGVGKRSIGKKINEEIVCLTEEFLAQKGKAFNPNDVINNAVSNIICSISFGERYEYDNTEFQFLLSHLRNVSTSTSFLSIVNVMPFLIYLPPFKKRLDSFMSIREFVSSKVKEHSLTLDPNDVRDVIDVYLMEVDKQSSGDKSAHYDINRAWRFIQDLFAAGSDTTSNSLMWAMALMSHYPEIQEKVFEEIKCVVGLDRFPTYEDKYKLPYTEAVILELQRFRPVVPLVGHESTSDTSLAGYFVPKGSKIMVNIWAVQNDPSIWEHPYDFIPERFLSPDGKQVRHNDSHIPFSVGRRVCLGESLAKMEIFLFFSSLVQKFRFKVPDGHDFPSLEGTHGVVYSISPFLVCAEPRI